VRDATTKAPLKGAIALHKGAANMKLDVHRVYPADRRTKAVHVRLLLGDTWWTETMFSEATKSARVLLTRLTTVHVFLTALYYSGCALDVYSSRVTDLVTGRHLAMHEDLFAATTPEGCVLVDDMPGTMLVNAVVVIRMSRGRGFAMERIFSLAQPCSKVLALILETLGRQIEESLGVAACQDAVRITLDNVPLPFTGADASHAFGDLPVVREILASLNNGRGPCKDHVVPLRTPIIIRAAPASPSSAALTTATSLLEGFTEVVSSLRLGVE
jgi:hypothetical protein